MPLERGYGQASISANIQKMIGEWKKTGRIGNSTPATLAEARKQAQATAYTQARISAKKMADVPRKQAIILSLKKRGK